MTDYRYFIIGFIVLLFSCGNKTTDITESNTYYTRMLPDSVRKVIEEGRLDSGLYATWAEFQQAAIYKDFTKFRRLSLDSLKCCDTTYSLTKFIENCFTEVFDTSLISKFSTSNDIKKIDRPIELGYFSPSVLKIADYGGKEITLKQFQIIKGITAGGPWTMTFDFIRTKRGYKFFGCDSFGGPICCR